MPLYSHTKAPPGEFYIWINYTPTTWEATLNGARGMIQFGPWPTPDHVALGLKDFLDGNNLSGGEIPALIELIDNWTCDRLGNNKAWCHEAGERTYAEATASPIVRRASGGGCCGRAKV